jgi:hypothetical protein
VAGTTIRRTCLLLAVIALASCGSTVWFSPSASDQEEAEYVGSIVWSLLPPKPPGSAPYTIYACRDRRSYRIDLYALTDRASIDALCARLSSYENLDRPLGTRSVEILFYERENVVTTGTVSLEHGGTAPFQERKEVLVDQRTVTLPKAR